MTDCLIRCLQQLGYAKINKMGAREEKGECYWSGGDCACSACKKPNHISTDGQMEKSWKMRAVTAPMLIRFVSMGVVLF
jgi:hypothetical protein